MNKEAMPFILAIFTPVIIVSIILLYFYGFDITVFIRSIDLIYYIIIFPFALGLFVAVLKLRKLK